MKSEAWAQSRQRTGIVMSRGGLGGCFFIFGLLYGSKDFVGHGLFVTPNISSCIRPNAFTYMTYMTCAYSRLPASFIYRWIFGYQTAIRSVLKHLYTLLFNASFYPRPISVVVFVIAPFQIFHSIICSCFVFVSRRRAGSARYRPTSAWTGRIILRDRTSWCCP